MALMVYDHFLTLEREAKYIWPSKLSSVTILYYITKYSSFLFVLVIALQTYLPSLLVAPGCKAVNIITGWMHVFSVMAAETILMIKAWAVWGRDRRMAIGLFLLTVVILAIGAVTLQLFLQSIHFSTSPIVISHISGCVVEDAKAIFCTADWILLIVLDSVVTMCLLLRGFQAYKSGGNRALYKTIFQDGIVYYFCALGISVWSAIMMNNLRPTLVLFPLSIARVLHVSLTTRLILRMRELADKTMYMFSDSFGEPTLTILHTGSSYDF
ncbi:hypothetical protein AMATHDRAFT_7157 [Amanita thiersii Skay4041]|uniref:DUF6533 domain-containing protein n=1 Tax=Amanita thiersii Skay4041 TaxID=703135 RepID=A0A2A9NH40_9AGAR|nr:hypothetical protein AMATHDRAFT_7157 [Amanita thiersii Skay4041]